MASHTMSKNMFSVLNENNDFPALGSCPDPSKNSKPLPVKFIIATSRIEQLRQQEYDARTQAFEAFKNKELNSKKLERTMPCRHVTTRKPNGDFGVCYRQYCTFAHSQQELKPRECNFDLSCRFRLQGAPRVCKFRHSNESVAQWLSRSGVKMMELPLTSEKSRVLPSVKVEEVNTLVEVKVAPCMVPRQLLKTAPIPSSAWGTKPLIKPEIRLFGNNQFFGKVPEPKTPVIEPNTEPKTPVIEPNTEPKIFDFKTPVIEIPETEYDTEDETEDEDEAPTKTEQHIIRVPTKELAEIALKALFDRGVFNVKVLIE